MKISVVIPVYNEEKNIEALHKRLSAVFEGLNTNEFECIFVNDGSTDESLNLICGSRNIEILTKIVKSDNLCINLK